MTIAYFLSKISTAGGVEKVTSVKANWLAQHSYKVHIICKERYNSSFFKYDSSVQIHGIYSYFISDKFCKQRENKRVSGIALWREKFRVKAAELRDRYMYESLLEKITPDIIVYPIDDLPALEAIFRYRCKNTKAKVIIERHEYRYGRHKTHNWPLPNHEEMLHIGILERIQARFGKTPQYKTLEDFYRAADALVALTDEDAQNYGRKDPLVIPNPITINAPQGLNRRGNKSSKVLAIGRYSPEKNFEALIEIWRKISPQYPDWVLSIRGDGITEGLSHLVQGVKNIQLEPSTISVDLEYISSEIFVMTSKTEGFPLVLVEAQLYGLPIVAYSCPCGPRAIVHNGIDGYLIEENDEQEFISKLTLLMRNKELREKMSHRARESARRYDLELIMQQWEGLFKRILLGSQKETE